MINHKDGLYRRGSSRVQSRGVYGVNVSSEETVRFERFQRLEIKNFNKMGRDKKKYREKRTTVIYTQISM